MTMKKRSKCEENRASLRRSTSIFSHQQSMRAVCYNVFILCASHARTIIEDHISEDRQPPVFNIWLVGRSVEPSNQLSTVANWTLVSKASNSVKSIIGACAAVDNQFGRLTNKRANTKPCDTLILLMTNWRDVCNTQAMIQISTFYRSRFFQSEFEDSKTVMKNEKSRALCSIEPWIVYGQNSK